MKQEWSREWVSSSQPRKQRKYVYNAPPHVKRKFLSARLSKELTQRYKRRSLAVRSGDMVEIMRGTDRGLRGKVEKVNLKAGKVYVAGITVKKVDGSTALKPVQPSNVRLVDLKVDDKMRAKALSKKLIHPAKEKEGGR